MKAAKKNISYSYKNVFEETSQMLRFDLYKRTRLPFYFKDKVVLDLGCGYGPDSVNFLKFAKKVTGSDILYHKDWERLKKRNLNFTVSSSESLNFKDNSFDGVFLKDLLHHLDKPEKTLKEIKRVTKKNGYIIIYEGNRYNPIFYLYATKFKKHDHFTQSEFKKMILKYFKDVTFLHIEAYPPFGLPKEIFIKVQQLESYISKIKPLSRFFSYNVAIIRA